MATFQDMALAEGLKKALRMINFIEPTDIQKAVLPIAQEHHDLMASAETGSGKTGAYGIALIAALMEDSQARGLILAPTRELAFQINDFLRSITRHCGGPRVAALVGGVAMGEQIRNLKKKPRLLVATPGRLTDHLQRGTLSLRDTRFLVLDEGDRMLDMGFAPQLDTIVEYLPKERQTFLFSATIPPKVRELAQTYLNKPQSISVGRVSQPVAAIKQSIVQLSFKEKDERIVEELKQRDGSIIVFARTKHRTDRLARSLKQSGFSVGLIHGGRTQGQRNQAIRNFKQGRSRILCATDIAARGIDIPQVEHVINFDLPMVQEDYVHRIGRTARNGAEGEAVSFVTPDDYRFWQDLARKYEISGVELKGVKKRGGPKKKNFRFGKGKAKSSAKKFGHKGRSFGKKTRSKSPAKKRA